MTWRGKKRGVSSSVIELPHTVKLFRLNKARSVQSKPGAWEEARLCVNGR